MEKGQKVYCIYHHTKWFKPPMCGKILIKLPTRIKHHFSKSKDGKCAQYVVVMENQMPVIIPEVCIYDLKKEIKKSNFHNKCPHDKKQIDAWLWLQEQQANKVKYLLSKS